MRGTGNLAFWCLIGLVGSTTGQDRKLEIVVQTGHTLQVTSASFSPNGQQIVTASWDTTAIIWNADTGTKLRTLKGHTNHLSSASYSPDGQRIVTASADGTAIIWDAASGAKLLTLNESDSPISGILEAVRAVKDPITGERAKRPKELTYKVNAASYSPDGTRIVTASDDNSAIVWEANIGAKLLTLKGHRNGVNSASYSPDGKRIVTGSEDKTAITWDAKTGTALSTIRAPNFLPVKRATFSPDGKRIVISCAAQTAIICDAAFGNQVGELRGHARTVNSAHYSPNGQRILTACGDWRGEVNQATVCDETTGAIVHTLNGHARTVNSAHFSPDGQRIVTASQDCTAIVWNSSTAQPLLTLCGRVHPVSSASFSPNSERFVVGSSDSTAVVWDALLGSKRHVLAGDSTSVLSASFSPDGRRIITGTWHGRVIVSDTATGTKFHTLEGGLAGAASYSPDGQWIFTACSENDGDGDGAVWNAETGAKFRSLEGHGRLSGINSARYSPDGKRIVTASDDQTAIVRDAVTGANIHTLKGHAGRVISASFSPDGKRIVTTSHDDTAIIWDAATGAKLRTLEGHARSSVSIWSGVNSASYSPDGKRIVTASWDTTAIIWDADTGTKLGVLKGHEGWVRSVSYSPNGQLIITASQDGTTRLWDSKTSMELAAIVSFDAGRDSLVVTPEGLFDGSKGGREIVAFRVDGKLDVVPVDRFFQDFYYPGLLAEISAGKRPVPGKALPTNPAPGIKLLVNPDAGTAPNRVTVDVAVTDTGGGVRGPFLQHNGAAVRGGQLVKENDKTKIHRFTLDLITGDNRIEARAATVDGGRESDPTVEFLSFAGKLPEPDLYVLAVGVNKHAAGAGVKDLKFAVPDAKAVADLFRQRAGGLYKQVHVTVLLDNQATRDGILKAVAEIARKARPQDTLVVYQSGHGDAVGQRFYLIPHDFKKASPAVAQPPKPAATAVAALGYRAAEGGETALKASALAADDLGEALATVPALRRVLIFDTCHSGGAVGLAGAGRNPFAFRGAVERFARAQGVYLLSAVAANDLAGEAPALGHGIMTYSLLAGSGGISKGPLAGKSLSADRPVDVLGWFGYAQANVPDLCRTYVGRPQHVEVAGSDQPSFPLLSPPK